MFAYLTNFNVVADVVLATNIAFVRKDGATITISGTELTFAKKGIYFAFHNEPIIEYIYTTEPIEQIK